jgi:superfamily II DNA/RNA helicase
MVSEGAAHAEGMVRLPMHRQPPPASAGQRFDPGVSRSKNSHFIATTVDLLSTGVDIPNLDNVVFFRYLESPISFYQMVGRGTRTGER